MGVEFFHPLYLLLLPICFGVTIFFANINLKKGFDKILFTAIRLTVLTLLILSLAGLSILSFSDKTSNVFLVDISSSMAQTQAKALQFIKESNATRTDKDGVGIVLFGENATVNSVVSFEQAPVSFDSNVETLATNIEEGLKFSGAILPVDAQKQITLISDGNQNVGDAILQAKLLKEQGVVVNVFPLKNDITQEVQLTEIKVPKTLKKDSLYDLEIKGDALNENGGRLLVYKNNAIIVDKDVRFNKGENSFIFSDTADKDGAIIYKAEIRPETDYYAENNTVFGYSYVEGAPNVLVVGNELETAEILGILNSSTVNVTQITPQATPINIAELSVYDAIILANVSLEDTGENFATLLETYVKDIGGGLFVSGGDSSFALGEYKDTPLEAALPLNMELKDKNKQPNLGMVIVVDRSGSMGVGKYGVSKLELAKESIIRSVDALNDKDYLGVIAFDDTYHIASEFSLVGENKEEMVKNIANISLGGGTSILPGLKAGYKMISAADTKVKHIILLTDGQAEQSGYETVIADLNREGITLSTVAVGTDSDIKLLKRLANIGKGRYYYSDEFTDLPKIFTKETQLAGKTFLNNDEFTPNVLDASAILDGINDLPTLGGYISTTKKDRADVVLTDPKEEPILATWEYGLGRSVAWTSDLANVWSGNWLSSNEGVEVFKNSLSWAMRKQLQTDISIKAKTVDKTTELNIFAPNFQDILSISATIIAPDLTKHDVSFKAISPGEFLGTLEESKQGAYIANVSIEKIGKTEQFSVGVNLSYGAEFDIRNFSRGDALLKEIAQITGGQIIANGKDIYNTKPQKAYKQNDLSNLLLQFALILFIIDIAVRRFPFVSNYLQNIFRKLSTLFVKLFSKKGNKIAVKNTIKTQVDVQNVKVELVKDAVQKPVKTANKLVSSKKKRTGK